MKGSTNRAILKHLEVLSKEYLSIKGNPEKKANVLNLESMQSLSKSLGLT